MGHIDTNRKKTGIDSRKSKSSSNLYMEQNVKMAGPRLGSICLD